MFLKIFQNSQENTTVGVLLNNGASQFSWTGETKDV